jgi:hypothetical protein
MQETHDVHHDAGAFGFASGFVIAIGALVLAAIIAGIVLLAAQPWEDDGGTADTPNVPGIEEPVGGDTGGAQPAQ